MDVKTLSITEVIVNKVDECKFALFNFMNKKCSYWLKGSYIQTLERSSYNNPKLLPSETQQMTLFG